MIHRKKRVLISAFACHPKLGSEAGVGWGWALAAARDHDVVVITESNNKSAIDDYFQSTSPQVGISFLYIPTPLFFQFAVWFHHFFPPLLHWLYVRKWQRNAYELGLRLHDEDPFDLVHNLTFVGFRLPGFWYRMGVPLVWGPIGGLEQTNLKLVRALGIQDYFYFLFRNLLNTKDKRFNRMARNAMAVAKGGIIAATTPIQREIQRWYGEDSTVMSEIGAPEVAVERPIERTEGEPLRLIWVGRFVPCKGFPFFVEAARRLNDRSRWVLDVFGDGLKKRRWERLADKRGLTHLIRWHGSQARGEVLESMKKAHALVVTSVYELTSTVVVEALSLGVPVICPDHCGFVDAVDENCGFRLRAETPEVFVHELKEALERLINDESLRRRLAWGALMKAREFCWERKADLLHDLYEKKLGNVRNE